MADIDENLAVWQRTWDWAQAGDEWSAWWGGTPAMWHGALMPRIHGFLPAGTILEIAPGHGRWTQFLKDACERLVLVDLTERCIEHCRERFADAGHIEYHVNDGRSLEMVPDGSIDFAFSFDSLVHAEDDVIEAYVGQLARKLRPEGAAFIHHSNAGSLTALSALAKRTPERLRRRLVARGAMLDVYAWRAESVTAEGVAAHCARAGLACISQERISWEHGRFLTDALTIAVPRGSRRARPLRTARNPAFGREGRRTAHLYATAR